MSNLGKYGLVIDETLVIDCERHTSIREHTIRYEKHDGLWTATLERWIDGDPGHWDDVVSVTAEEIWTCRKKIILFAIGRGLVN